MSDSNTLDNWAAAIVILIYVAWFLYQISKPKGE